MQRYSVVSKVVVLVVLAGGCAATSSITDLDPQYLDPLDTTHVERGGIALRATVLAKPQAKQLLRINVADRSVIPVAFALTNSTPAACSLRREDFRLRVDDLIELEPMLPGRAATVLRDSSEGDTAIMAGFLIFGALAAPSVHEAQQHQEAAVQDNRQRVFATTEIAPGETTSGYLFFESPTDVKNAEVMDLEVRPGPAAGTACAPELIGMRLSNPYARRATGGGGP
jgi:hypothetical protein